MVHTSNQNAQIFSISKKSLKVLTVKVNHLACFGPISLKIKRAETFSVWGIQNHMT